MNYIELKHLILLQVAIDFIIFIMFIFLIRRLRFADKDSSLNAKLKLYESLLADANNMSSKFNEMLEEKKVIIKTLSEHLENKVKKLNSLLNRTDALLVNYRGDNEAFHNKDSFKNHKDEIVQLAKEGFDLDYIADNLSVPKEEVMLVLDLMKKISHFGSKEGVS
ncbi:MAG: hypothetical protein R6W88_06125 [Desulfobacterales bacterium]